MRLRAHLRAFGAAVLADVRASVAAPVVERLRADLKTERAKSEDLAQRCAEREGRLGAAYADLCEETKRADRAEIELKAARANADRFDRGCKAASIKADDLTEAMYALARHVGAPHATVEHIAHTFDVRIGDLYERLTHAQEIANVALDEGLAACDALRAQERDLRASQDTVVRELRAELKRIGALYSAEADRRVKLEDVLFKVRATDRNNEPVLHAAFHHVKASDPAHDTETLRALRAAIAAAAEANRRAPTT